MSGKQLPAKPGGMDLERYKTDPTATCLDLSNMKLSNAQFSEITSLLDKSKGLTELNLEKCGLGDDRVASLVKALENNTTIRKLNLSYNLIAKNSLKIIEKTVSNNLTLMEIKLKEKPMDLNGMRFDALPAPTLKVIEDCVRDNILVQKYVAGEGNTLKLLNRKLERIPGQLLTFQHLAVVNISGSLITAIPPEIGKCVNLERATFSKNMIAVLPKEIGQMGRLQWLDVSYNQISTLPETIVLLEQLQYLDISNNKVKKLPTGLGTMDRLQKIKVLGNQLNRVPKEIVDSGNTQDLKTYLRESENSEKCYRMKLMFVGKENSGKTTLLKCLMKGSSGPKSSFFKNLPQLRNDMRTSGGGPDDQQHENLSTDGIEIREWTAKASSALQEGSAGSVPSARQNDVTFCTFDFAGQEVYYTSHQFFLSSRSIYLVVFNILEGLRTLDKVDYWLQSVQVRASSAPVVLVATHTDDPRCTEEYIVRIFNEMRGQLSKEYNVRAQIAVSCKTGAGIDELRSKLLELAWTQPSMGEKIPASYLSLETKVKNIVASKTLVPPTMSWREFRQLGTECGLSDRSVSAAAQFLHDLGSLVYFHEMDADLHDVVILDPQWITDLLASIITTKQNFVRDGFLKHSDLPFIWRFDAAMHLKLLRLLERFEVSFQMPDGDRSLIPCMLPESKPEFDTLWVGGTQHYYRWYELSFAPKGLFSRLIVRLLHFSRGAVMWQHGIVLVEEGAKALIEHSPREKTLAVWVRGNANVETMLRLILDTLEALLTSWFHVPYQRFVPCPLCRKVPDYGMDAHLFPYEEVTLAFASGGASKTMACKVNPLHAPTVRELAPDVSFADFKGTIIEQRDLDIGDLVANTAVGAVYHGYWQKEEVAIKEVRLHAVASTDEKLRTFYAFRHEVWMMAGVTHPNVVQLRGFSLNPFFLILEWVPNGDLYQWLHKPEQAAKVTNPMRLRMALDIAGAMAFLHSQAPPILHRDLKTPNVFVASIEPGAPVMAKVADFGLASRLFIAELKEKSKNRAVETPTWLAPEVLLEHPYTEKSDVYAFGIILWELYTGAHPFGEFQFKFSHQLEDAIKNGIRPLIPSTTPAGVRDLITACWDPSPAKRPLFPLIISVLTNSPATASPLLRASSANLPSSSPPTAIHMPPNSNASAVSHAPLRSASLGPGGIQAPPPVDKGSRSNSNVFANGTLDKTLLVRPALQFTSICAISADRVLIGTQDGAIAVFSARTGEQLDVKPGVHVGAIRALVCMGNDLFTGGEDGVVAKFSLRGRSNPAEGDLSGMLNKLHGKAFLSRLVPGHFALSPVQDELLYYKRKGDLEPKRRIQLAGAVVESGERKDGQYTFKVVPRSGKTVVLAAEREDERARWVAALRGAVERTRDALSMPTLTKKLGKPIISMAPLGPEIWAACKTAKELYILTTTGVQMVPLQQFAAAQPVADSALYPSFAPQVAAPPQTASAARDSTAAAAVRDLGGSLTALHNCGEVVWAAVEKHLYRVERASRVSVALSSPHLAPVTALCTTPDGALWSASSDRLCSWPPTLDCTAPAKQVELTLASVVCLLPLGQFVWLGGADGRTKKPVIKVWLATETTCVKDIDTPHSNQLSSMAAVNSRSVWSVSRDSSICSWV